MKNFSRRILRIDTQYSPNLNTSTEKLQISEPRPSSYSKQSRSPRYTEKQFTIWFLDLIDCFTLSNNSVAVTA